MAKKKPAAGPIPRDALDYFKRKGLKPGFSYKDVWREEHSVAFTVAKIVEEDILASVRGIVDRSIEEGTTFEQFKKDIKPLIDKSGWSNYGTPKQESRRLRTVYDTNMRVARSAGQWGRIQRTKKALPFLQYNLGPSVNHRPEHEAWEGIILPVDDPWWDTHFTPNGYGCKCHIRQISKFETEKLGGVSERPAEEFDEWVNQRTGKLELVPHGVQPGFDYNPGKDRTAGIEFAESQKGTARFMPRGCSCTLRRSSLLSVIAKHAKNRCEVA